MRVEGAYTFPGNIQYVFATLTNPDALARAIPGCERFLQFGPMNADGDITYETRLRLGRQRQPYTLTLQVKAVRRPTYLTLEIRGHGPSGLMTGSGSIDLVEQDEHTVVAYRFSVAGAQTSNVVEAPSQEAAFAARVTCAHLADEIYAETEDADVRRAVDELVTPRGRIVTSFMRRRGVRGSLPWTERAMWMTAGLAMGLGAIALTVGVVRRIGSDGSR